MAKRIIIVNSAKETVDYFNLEQPIFPTKASTISSDVMLIQFLVNEFYFTMLPTLKQAIAYLDVKDSATKNGKRWDDGHYGPKSLAAFHMWEEQTGAPVRDGIFRPVPADGMNVFFKTDVPKNIVTFKLNMLNSVFQNKDDFIGQDRDTMRQVIKIRAHPLLYQALYPTDKI